MSLFVNIGRKEAVLLSAALLGAGAFAGMPDATMALLTGLLDAGIAAVDSLISNLAPGHAAP